MQQPPHEYADATFRPYEVSEPRPPRKNRRSVVIAVGALLPLVLVPVAVDRFAAAQVESASAGAEA